jgi:tetratricopeptide (TPR) repeat protein
MTQKTNPYNTGNPPEDEKGFFGREDILTWVTNELKNPNTNSLVLYGQRRIGKTAILLQFRGWLPNHGFLPIYFDLEYKAEKSLGEVLDLLAQDAAKAAGIDNLDLEPFDNEGSGFISNFLPMLYAKLDSNIRPVFLFDEFDVLNQIDEYNLPDYAAARTLFPFLRQVINNDKRVAFIYVIGRRPSDLRLDFRQIFKTSLREEIWVLKQKDADELIRQAEKNDTLKFSPDAIARILRLTNCHPYLTQSLCQRIWEEAYTKKPTEIPKITAKQVNSAIEVTLKASDSAFDWIWDGLGPAEKVYIAAFANIANERETISEQRVINILHDHASRLKIDEVDRAPHYLEERRVLENVGNNEYRFAIDLFRRWISQKYPYLKDVVDEIDRINPLADSKYKVGKLSFDRHEWKEAIRYFKEALDANKDHYRAREHLGKSYLEIAEYKKAIFELEKAYELDEKSTQQTLVRAYVEYANVLEKNNSYEDEETALDLCEKALRIKPDDQDVEAILSRIWEKRGDNAFSIGDLDSALQFYQNAANEEKQLYVKSQQEKRAMENLTDKAKRYEKQKAWDDAIEIYEQLLNLSNAEENKKEWETALQHCKQEKQLSDEFDRGLGALAQGENETARRAFANVINIRPDYSKDGKTASRLLEQANTAYETHYPRQDSINEILDTPSSKSTNRTLFSSVYFRILSLTIIIFLCLVPLMSMIFFPEVWINVLNSFIRTTSASTPSSPVAENVETATNEPIISFETTPTITIEPVTPIAIASESFIPTSASINDQIDTLLGIDNWSCTPGRPTEICIYEIPSNFLVEYPFFQMDSPKGTFRTGETIPGGYPGTGWISGRLTENNCPTSRSPITQENINALFGEGNWYCLDGFPNGIYVKTISTSFDVQPPIIAVDKNNGKYCYEDTVPGGGAATVWLHSDISSDQCP